MKQKIERLRSLMGKATPGKWGEGHLSHDDHPCQCAYVFSGGYMGSIAQISVRNDLPLGEGGNDNPPLVEAKANLSLIVEMKNALPDLLSHIDALEARVAEAETIAGIATIPDVAGMAERLEAAERALAEAVEVLRAIDGHVSHAKMGDWSIALNEIRKLARAFLTKRGEK